MPFLFQGIYFAGGFSAKQVLFDVCRYASPVERIAGRLNPLGSFMLGSVTSLSCSLRHNASSPALRSCSALNKHVPRPCPKSADPHSSGRTTFTTRGVTTPLIRVPRGLFKYRRQPPHSKTGPARVTPRPVRTDGVETGQCSCSSSGREGVLHFRVGLIWSTGGVN